MRTWIVILALALSASSTSASCMQRLFKASAPITAFDRPHCWPSSDQKEIRTVRWTAKTEVVEALGEIRKNSGWYLQFAQGQRWFVPLGQTGSYWVLRRLCEQHRLVSATIVQWCNPKKDDTYCFLAVARDIQEKLHEQPGLTSLPTLYAVFWPPEPDVSEALIGEILPESPKDGTVLRRVLRTDLQR